ncbi:hypothetical protein Poli38472_009575 [Pythium oligandrum]|uniref:Carboxypeptidase n=1 Tax=Pythium oligandrum TaxID=41045 RepID=A0A8K1CH73_PYTOL|nr:hypothetical protein Poli38472_009575 [Pythium oligandrum]|eukprot:TMW62082.1 hypothetical protein Poli38472_009575 [Pythium oligandrum]
MARIVLAVCLASIVLLAVHTSVSTPSLSSFRPALKRQHGVHFNLGDVALTKHDEDRVTYVPGFGAPLETQYAGLVNVNNIAIGKLFYWFFEARVPNTPQTPLILWLNGGPGASSMTGLLTEMGPYRITGDGKLIPHAHSWTQLGHMLFFDQPVGTGYSSVRDDVGYVKSQDEMAEQLYRGLQEFYARHPEYLENPVYVCGESYAGKYVPSISYYIHRRNQVLADKGTVDDEVRINLVGIAVGNGIMWPVLQTRSVPDFAIALGLIDSQEYEKANVDISVCEEYHRQGRHVDAFQVCQAVTDRIYKAAGNPFIYDIRKRGNAFDALTTTLSKYFNDDNVRRALNVPLGTPWNSIDGGSFGVSASAPALVRHLQEDEMLDVPIDVFRDLMDNYKFLFYAGNMDGSACNNLGVGRMIDRLAWKGTGDYRIATRRPWLVNDQVAGLTKSAGNMSYVVVMNAGHLVPTDQPEAALDMMRRFLGTVPYFV